MKYKFNLQVKFNEKELTIKGSINEIKREITNLLKQEKTAKNTRKQIIEYIDKSVKRYKNNLEVGRIYMRLIDYIDIKLNCEKLDYDKTRLNNQGENIYEKRLKNQQLKDNCVYVYNQIQIKRKRIENSKNFIKILKPNIKIAKDEIGYGLRLDLNTFNLSDSLIDIDLVYVNNMYKIVITRINNFKLDYFNISYACLDRLSYINYILNTLESKIK